ncbi:MAG: insulinase family protein [Lentisphaeria bacterium]|nr:insulinase family protein [Lentisphaeria bacterium]
MKLFSALECRTFPNGLTLYVLPRPGSAAFDLQLAVRTGSVHEGENLGCGLSHFLEHMLFQGCRDFPGRSGSEAVEKCGGSVNAYTSFDHTVYYARVPEARSGLALDLLCGMVRYPELPEARFREEKEVIQRECDRYFDAPMNQLFLAGFGTCFGPHPARIPITGCRERIPEVTRDMAAAYHARRYTPGRCFLVASGAVDPERVADEVEKRLGDWAPGDLSEPVLPAVPPRLAPLQLETTFPDTLSKVMLLYPPLPREDMLKSELLAGILTGSTGSPLVRVLEQEKELALSVSASSDDICGYHIFGLTALSTPGKLDKLESALLRELERIASGALTEAELRREKTQRYAGLLRRLCVPESLAPLLVSGVLTDNNPAWAEWMTKRLNAITIDELRDFAAKLLSPDRLLTVRQRPAPAGKRSSKTAENALPGCRYLDAVPGVPLLFAPDHAVEQIEFSVILPGGAIHEKEDERGLSPLVSAALLTGAGKRSESRLGAAADRCGMHVSLTSGRNSFLFRMTAPRRYFKEAFALAELVLTAPDFPAGPFEREKEHKLEKIRRRAMKPAKAAWAAGCDALYGSHPYNTGDKAMPGRIAAFTPIQAGRYWRSLWKKEHVFMGIAGDISPDEAIGFSSSLCGKIAWNDTPSFFPPLPVFPGESKFLELPIEREQTVVMQLLPTPCLRREMSDLYLFLDTIENNMSSRLFEHVREECALAYSVGTKMEGGFHPGVFAFSAATTPEGVPKVRECFADEIGRLGREGVTAEEFESARETLLFHTAQLTESAYALLDNALLNAYYGDPLPEREEIRRRISSYTLQQFNAVLAQYFTDPATVTVTAGKLK